MLLYCMAFAVMLNVAMVNVIMLSGIILNVIILIFDNTECYGADNCYAECHYGVCRYIELRYSLLCNEC